MQFFYYRDEARVNLVKKAISKFCILKPSEKVKIIKPCRKEPALDYDSYKVIIFNLPNCISPLTPKLYGKMKQKPNCSHVT